MIKALSDNICANSQSEAYFSFAIDVEDAATETVILLGLVQDNGIIPIPRVFAAIAPTIAR